ncbi:MAG: ABC transporter permease [Actinobacteria bacterium]|nr:ABC transporter permease [Actinomycetota bacterium]
MTAPATRVRLPAVPAWGRHLEFRNELLAMLALLAMIQLFPRRPVLGIYALGVAEAAPLVLHAAAVVLVYRANKFVNFAQLQLAGVAAVLFTALVQGQFFLNVTRSVCGCVSREPGAMARNINFALALIVAVGLTALVSWAGYLTVLRRFRRSPRIMLTLVTVFVGQALAGMHSQIQNLFIPTNTEDPAAFQRIARRPTRPPGDFVWQVDPIASLRLADVLLIVAAAGAVVGVTLYFRHSRTGIAIRAAAENPARAQTLGVDVQGVTSRVWLLAGLLGGVAGVLGAFGSSVRPETNTIAIPAGTLTVILAVAVMARFHSLPMVAAAAVALGVLRAAVQYAFASTTPLDAALVFLIGGLLLLQRAKESRAHREDASGYEVTREVRPIPHELRVLPQVRTWMRGGAIVAVAVLAGLPWALSSSTTTLVTVFAIYSIVGLSILILTGWAGQVSLGQFGFAAIGAWAAAVSNLPFPLALLLGGAVGAAASVVVGVPALKLHGLNLAISTLAFAVSARALFVDDRYLGGWLPESIERPAVLGMDFDDSRVFYYFTLVMVAVCCAAVVGLRRSRSGRVLIGLRANEAAAQSFGINPLRARLTAFAVAGFLAAFAGGLFAFHQREVTPQSFTADISIEMFVFAVIGGLGGILGPLLGFTYMGLLTLLGTNPLIRYTGAGTGALLLLFAAPGGLAQVFYDMRDSALRRLAVRLRIPVPSLMGEGVSRRALDRVHLDEKRGPAAAATSSSLLYRLEHQWALDRYGREDGGNERVGRTEAARG